MAKTAKGNTESQEPTLFMTASEVARALRIGRSTLDQMVGRGVFPAPIRFTAKTVRWPRAQVEALAQGCNQ